MYMVEKNAISVNVNKNINNWQIKHEVKWKLMGWERNPEKPNKFKQTDFMAYKCSFLKYCDT